MAFTARQPKVAARPAHDQTRDDHAHQSGDAYVYNTTINAPVHVAADGSYAVNQLVNFVLISKGSSPNMRITISLDQVFASDGTLISETSDFFVGLTG